MVKMEYTNKYVSYIQKIHFYKCYYDDDDYYIDVFMCYQFSALGSLWSSSYGRVHIEQENTSDIIIAAKGRKNVECTLLYIFLLKKNFCFSIFYYSFYEIIICFSLMFL